MLYINIYIVIFQGRGQTSSKGGGGKHPARGGGGGGGVANADQI